jgi:tetratricopeptide (TPR) repeat protein
MPTLVPACRPGRALALALAGLLPVPALAAPSPADRAIAAAARRVQNGRALPDAYVELAAALMKKSRESADPADYRRAAAALDRAVALDPQHYGALRVRAWVLLGQHDFRGARAAAEQALAREPRDWWNYATLADALSELGEYDRATTAVERLMELRPGIAAYTRAAFVRALTGDRAGAIAILERAAAGSTGDAEGLAWTLVHLGHERFAGGELGAAALVYARALAALPEYHLALGGLARVRAAEGRFGEAIALYRRAVALVPAPDLVAALGDVHAAAGDADEAEEQYALVEQMGRLAAAAGSTHGRQLALFYADHDRQLPEALRLARQEAAMRGDIYSDDALAWALYRNGRFAEAARAAHRALRLGTPDAALHYHAGMIAAALGRPRRGAAHLRRALALNSHFDLLQAPTARDTLAALEAGLVLRTGNTAPHRPRPAADLPEPAARVASGGTS